MTLTKCSLLGLDEPRSTNVADVSSASALRTRLHLYRKYSWSTSTLTLLRPTREAAIVVLPVPPNGSSTVSPTKLKHLNQSLCQFDWKGCRMIPAGSTGNTVPDLLEPYSVIVGC